MIQLALETTGKTGSIAVLRDDTPIWHQRVGVQQRSAADMAIRLQSGLEFCRERDQKLDFISVATGPGSFTGLRIAITTAKTLAYALRIPVVAVGSLAAIAASTDSEPAESAKTALLVGLNAYRGQVFAAKFEFAEWARLETSPLWQQRTEVWSRETWDLESARAIETGDMLVRCEDSIRGELPPDLLAQEVGCQAAGVGRIAAAMTKKVVSIARPDGAYEAPFLDPFELAANYIKPSAAEEKAAKR